jgi:hypothetical protein
MNEVDQEYYRNRERRERAAAKNATCSDARRAHQELAESYAALARADARMTYIGPGSPPRRLTTTR